MRQRIASAVLSASLEWGRVNANFRTSLQIVDALALRGMRTTTAIISLKNGMANRARQSLSLSQTPPPMT